MMTYEIHIAGLTRHLPLCPLNDELYIGAFVMFGDTELTVHASTELLRRAPAFDVILTAEAKGIPLAYEMSRQSGKPYVVARKGVKLYMKDIVSCEVRSITTTGEQTLYLDGEKASWMKGARVLLVDDVISTGESLRSLSVLTEMVGGTCVGNATVLAEGDAIRRDDLIYLQKLPLFNKHGEPLAD